MSATGFTKKQLRATITLASGAGTFDGTPSNSVTLSGLRMGAELVQSGGESMGFLQLRVFGLTQAMMNQLTILGGYNRVNPQNQILLEAGDDLSALQMVFQGTIEHAWIDYNSAPDAAFNLMANCGLDALLRPVAPSSYQGSTDVATIMADLAKIMGLTFENNGVQVKLAYPYFPGTALMQVRSCARAARINYAIDRGVLAIWPEYQGRQGEIPLISKETGLIGYPQAAAGGALSIKTAFNWNIRNGGLVKVVSDIPMANKTFTVSEFSHSLSSETPGGPWFTMFTCYV